MSTNAQAEPVGWSHLRVPLARANSQSHCIPPEKIELLWDNWCSLSENGNLSARHFPLPPSPASASHALEHEKENWDPASGEAVITTTTPATGKRWGLFSKKSKAKDVAQRDTMKRQPARKMSRKLLKKPSQLKLVLETAPHDGGEAITSRGPDSHLPSQPPTALSVACDETTPQAALETPRSEEPSEIYFIMDPNWNGSQGSVDLLFVPAPAWRDTEDALCRAPA